MRLEVVGVHLEVWGHLEVVEVEEARPGVLGRPEEEEVQEVHLGVWGLVVLWGRQGLVEPVAHQAQEELWGRQELVEPVARLAQEEL